MSRSQGVVHGVAYCLDCDWSTQDPKTVRATAARHARKHGHSVAGEVAIAFSYDYRGKGVVKEVEK